MGTGTISHDLNRWWHQVRGKEDPYLKIGEVNDRATKGASEYVWALRDVNFEVKQGEVLGIIGKNGAGKSTLLKLLSRVTSPTTGAIKAKGRIASLLEVGTGFHDELTGRENIFLNGAILGMKKAEIRVKLDEIIAFSGTERYIDTPVKRYSSGMRVRLAFAVAAHLEPEILIVDEVLAVGDAEFQKKAIGKMQDISSGGGRTVLFVSHNMGAVRDLCTRSILLSNGGVEYDGETSDVITYYLEKNKKSKEEIKISERKDRKGDGQIIVDEVNFYDFNTKRKTDSVISGEDLLIEIKYKKHNCTLLKLDEFIVGLSFHTKEEQFIIALNNKMAGNIFYGAPSTGTVYCKVPRVPLMHGIFYLDVGLTVNRELSDFVSKGVFIEVLNGDYFKTGTPNAHNRQGVYIDQNWTNTKFD